MIMILVVCVSLGLGGLLGWVIAARRLIELNKELAKAQVRLSVFEEQIARLTQAASETETLRQTVGALQTERGVLQQQLSDQRVFLTETKTQSKIEFENLAHQILDLKTKSLTENTEKSLDILLKPLREKIAVFEKAVDDKYTVEAKERFALKVEIEKLISLNDRMASEASSLTQALRGDAKVQGDWGEMVLKRVLEASGLREGHEYSEQQSLSSDEGDRLRPDVVINLPDGKHVVVDSKVSLKAYDLYRSAGDEASKAKLISEHIKSIERHVAELGEKNYARLKGVNSPEVVFMFVPIEPAYILAMHADAGLSLRAWQKGVAIVTATTLLTSLKTVASIWRLEKQNRNALEIAQEGAKLYDKFVGFLEDFEKIGHTLEAGQKQFGTAMGKLRDGPGNVIRKIEHLRELGASPKHSISRDLLE